MRDQIAQWVTLIFILLAKTQMAWMCWTSLETRDKVKIALITPLIYPLWLVWQIDLHFWHRSLVKQGLAKREWFSGLLW